jgi:hypothetical protein
LTPTRVSDARPMMPAGFKAGALHCGIRARKSKLDLGFIVGESAYPAAAIFTRNMLVGAHVTLCRESLEKSGGLVRALLVNSGNANCSTGDEGLEDARRIQGSLAEILGCPPEQVLFMSTGVIGARLPVESSAAPRRSRWMRNIMTTCAPSSAGSIRSKVGAPSALGSRGNRVPGPARRTDAPSSRKSSAFERATRLCRMSPQIATTIPSRLRPSRFRIVNASSRACVGCSCMPSPALTTAARVRPAT